MEDIKGLLAQGLWNVYETRLPDTPQRVAQAIILILEKQGLEIAKIHK